MDEERYFNLVLSNKNYINYNVNELKQICRNIKIKGISKLKKSEIIELFNLIYEIEELNKKYSKLDIL